MILSMPSSKNLAVFLQHSLRTGRCMVRHKSSSPLKVRIAGVKHSFSTSVNVPVESKAKLAPVEPKPGAHSGVIGEIKVHSFFQISSEIIRHPSYSHEGAETPYSGHRN